MKPRVKTHSFPGDVSKREKIAMLEGKLDSQKRSKTFKSVVKMRERATLKRQTDKEIKEQTGG